MSSSWTVVSPGNVLTLEIGLTDAGEVQHSLSRQGQVQQSSFAVDIRPADGPNAASDPTSLMIREYASNNKGTLVVKLAPAGGMAGWFEPRT